MHAFDPEEFFPRELFDRITDTRVTRPEVIVEEARERARRTRLTRDGRLTILAADHPARMVLLEPHEPASLDAITYCVQAILMLGGESRGDPSGILAEFSSGMRAGSTVRGALVGRNVTFPGPEDPLAVALAVEAIVHRGFSAEQAMAHLREVRGKEMDRFTRLIAA